MKKHCVFVCRFELKITCNSFSYYFPYFILLFKEDMNRIPLYTMIKKNISLILDMIIMILLDSEFLYKELLFSHCVYILESGRSIPGSAEKGAVAPGILVTSGTGEKLRGTCVYFLRTKTDIAITSKNVYEVSFKTFCHN